MLLCSVICLVVTECHHWDPVLEAMPESNFPESNKLKGTRTSNNSGCLASQSREDRKNLSDPSASLLY